MPTLDARLLASATATLTDDAPTNDLGTGSPGSLPAVLTSTLNIANGTGAGQADLVFSDTRTLTASTNEDLDLAGALTDALGNTITMARVVAVIVTADAANVTDIVVADSGATNAWAALFGGPVNVRPGATLAVFAGAGDATTWAVGAGATDELRIGNSGGTDADYSIVIIGASA